MTAPTNYFGGNKYELDYHSDVGRSSYFFMRTTFHNIQSGEDMAAGHSSPLLWVHLGIFYVQSGMLYYFIYRYHRDVVNLASAVEAKTASAACTVLIYGLPTYVTRDGDLYELLRMLFPNATVLAANIVMRMNKLERLKNQVRTTVLPLLYSCICIYRWVCLSVCLSVCLWPGPMEEEEEEEEEEEA